MSNPFTPSNATEVTKPVTRPLWLVEIHYDPIIRLSSRGDVTLDGETFQGANIDVDLRSRRLIIFNEDLQWSSAFLAGTAGIQVNIWKSYVDGALESARSVPVVNDADEAVANDADEAVVTMPLQAFGDLIPEFSGEMGGGVIGTKIEINLRAQTPAQTPRLAAVPPTFNHLPPAGTKIITPTGITILEAG